MSERAWKRRCTGEERLVTNAWHESALTDKFLHLPQPPSTPSLSCCHPPVLTTAGLPSSPTRQKWSLSLHWTSRNRRFYPSLFQPPHTLHKSESRCSLFTASIYQQIIYTKWSLSVFKARWKLAHFPTAPFIRPCPPHG